ncbi:MAG: diacylglycerol kinase family protein [Nannocystaceae bacterium]
MHNAVGVITNPNSKKNWRFPERRGAIQRAVGRFGVVKETQSLDELPRAVDELLDAGTKYWVCDGGDGTLHWVVNTLKDRLYARAGDDADLPVIVPTNGGTVDFIARKAGLKGDAVSIVNRLVRELDRGHEPETVRVDTCRHRGVGLDQAGAAVEFDRIGMATALAGVANNFFDRYYSLPKDRGALAIAGVIGAAAGEALVDTVTSPLRRLLPGAGDKSNDFFRPTAAHIEVDGRRLGFTSFMSLQVGSIDINLAGVVRCFRHAHEDGVLHFQAISTSPVGVVFNVPNIVFGTPIRGRNVYDDRARRISIVAAQGDRINPVIDGEQFYGLDRVDLELGPSLRIATLPAA